MKQIRKRLTYANVMSSIAVFLILGGASAFAASQLGKNSVGTKQLKKNAVTAAKIQKNAVTTAKIKDNAVNGAKVDEASLGKVPSATKADSASTATTANTATHATTAQSAVTASSVNGVASTKIDYRANVSGPAQIFSGGGLTLSATCAAGDNITINATTSKANASIYTSVVDTDSNDNNLNADLESGGFDVGDNFDLLAGNDGNPGLATFEYDANDGTTVTGTIAVDEDNIAGTQCQAHGVVFTA